MLWTVIQYANERHNEVWMIVICTHAFIHTHTHPWTWLDVREILDIHIRVSPYRYCQGGTGADKPPQFLQLRSRAKCSGAVALITLWFNSAPKKRRLLYSAGVERSTLDSSVTDMLPQLILYYRRSHGDTPLEQNLKQFRASVTWKSEHESLQSMDRAVVALQRESTERCDLVTCSDKILGRTWTALG